MERRAKAGQIADVAQDDSSDTAAAAAAAENEGNDPALRRPAPFVVDEGHCFAKEKREKKKQREVSGL